MADIALLGHLIIVHISETGVFFSDISELYKCVVFDVVSSVPWHYIFINYVLAMFLPLGCLNCGWCVHAILGVIDQD